jgi:hypothetical protein
MRIQLPARVEAIEVEQCVEDKEITADCFAAVHGIIGEQNHMPLPRRRIGYRQLDRAETPGIAGSCTRQPRAETRPLRANRAPESVMQGRECSGKSLLPSSEGFFGMDARTPGIPPASALREGL